MKKTYIITSLVVIAIAALLIQQTSCTKTQFKTPTYSTGTANFTTFISVGNSLTQGYMDGGLYSYGQSHSYPAIMAQQIQLADPSMTFRQPLVLGNGSGYMHLVYVNGELTPVNPEDTTYGPNPCDSTTGFLNYELSYRGQTFNNLGISGILLRYCVPQNNPNSPIINNVICGYQYVSLPPPYTSGMYGNPAGSFLNFGSFTAAHPTQYIDFIRASKATFFTCWLGNNDVLQYALSGGVVTVTATPLGNVAGDEITSPAEFAEKYDSVLLAFHSFSGCTGGVCATIPDVTSIPNFNTVPNYIMVNGARQYLWITTAAGVRQAIPGDLILLSAYSAVLGGQGLTQSNPLPNGSVLDVTEVDSVENATNAYNASIMSLAGKYGYAVVDMHAYLTSLQSSITIDGMTFSRQYIQGGAFGLDGVHPSAIGYALVANQFIAAINAKYGSTIPPADISKYRGVLFPTY
ncbi:MAG: hypothetical protein ACLQQ4_09430 [Bacteroidia bacterium]